MIHYFSENDFVLKDKIKRKKWLQECIQKEGYKTGEINYIFCSDEQLLKINIEHLDHDFYTDIITFDYRENQTIAGDIFISTDRVKENAEENKMGFETELNRVLSHGVLHIMGYKDKTEADVKTMREKEDFCIKLYENI